VPAQLVELAHASDLLGQVEGVRGAVQAEPKAGRVSASVPSSVPRVRSQIGWITVVTSPSPSRRRTARTSSGVVTATWP
jgi:hypothetical protein